jgi:tRNA A-37 threonylcarbamoyl transferase component Bud32
MPGEEAECSLCKGKAKAPEVRIAPGAVIGDFAVVRELGRGGNGIVYLARQISLDRPVALKILQDKYVQDKEFVENFIREARAAARISHPNIVQAYAVGEDDGIYYFAMEFIDGETMKQVLKHDKSVPAKRAAEIVADIANAIDCAWSEQKLVHQDIKPDNIMLTKRGQAKLADLGLARIASVEAGFGNDDDEVMGTPQYISPEQLTGVPTDIRSDIYSLGASFYHMVTGRFPYVGKDGNEIARQHVEGTLTQPISVVRELPPEINRIIVKMMAKDITQRYQSGKEVAADLEKFLHPAAPAAPAAPTTQLGGVRAAEGPKLGESRQAASKLSPQSSGLQQGGPKIAPSTVMPKPEAAADAEAEAEAAVKPTVVKPSIVIKHPAPKPAAAAPAAAAPAEGTPAAAVPGADVVGSGATPPGIKPPDAKKPGMGLKSVDEDEKRAAPPMVTAIDKMIEDGPKKDYSWIKKTVKIILFILIPILFLAGLAAGAYFLDKSGKTPEKMKPYQDKVLVFLRLKASDAAGSATKQTAPTPVKPEVAAATKPLPPPPPPPKPKPVTRPEYLAGVDQLLAFLQGNPQDELGFLERADDFFIRFPRPQTPEEKTSVDRILEIYGRTDNRLRIVPARQAAQAAQEKAIAGRKAAAEAKTREEQERQAAQQAAVDKIAASSQQTAQTIAARDRELYEALKTRTEEYRVEMAALQKTMICQFFDQLDAPEDKIWRELNTQVAAKKTNLPVNATPDEKAVTDALIKLSGELNAEYGKCRELYNILYTPAKISQLNVELPRRQLVVVQSFADGVIRARTGAGEPLDLPMSNLGFRRRLLGRLERKFQFEHAEFYYALLFKDIYRLPPDRVPSPFLKENLRPMLEIWLGERWKLADEAGRDALRKQFGELPEFQKIAQ